MAESSPASRRRESRRQSQNGLHPSLSSSDSLRKLRCSICVKVFTDPVSTQCGHIFCKSCLNKLWKNKQTISCPYCGKTLTQRPDPENNTTSRDISEQHQENSPEENAEVVCDVCEDRKLNALKSCLVCQSSYCQIHLEPHSRVAGLMKHKLIDPVRNLEDYICQKHDRPLELFCREDDMCVCPFCIEGDHKDHITVPIEDVIKERKIDVQQKIQEKTEKIEEIKKSAEDRKIHSEKEKAAHVELFTDLSRSIERCQTELLEMMEEQQKAAEKQEEELIEELEKEITELKMRNTELQQLSHTEDHLHLLQIYSSLCSSTDTSLPDINAKTHENLENLRKAFVQLKGNIEEKLEQTLSAELKWVQKHAVDVTLDPDTAHVGLILSKAEKQVRLGEMIQKLPDKPQRFEKCICVLGKEGFSSGRFYFEVQVKGKTKWDLGVARESVDRKGDIRLCPSKGFWTVWLRNGNEYKALASPSVPLSLKVKPQRVGVFVDYEEGLVSFYDVESSSHIYSFTGQTFTDKLYPYFNPCNNADGKNSDPLIITPLGDSKI
ncbi:E3 ubiquitin-protein ligase TRIM39 [Danio aesculapii]|uniref:E3 ubiquitin-protein ligase TRIM39 n=1 Tax=Danio aesculapii TaxID=1142201 RepID=UPI0024BFA24F|nr:E3 ubiquitin-protein ligase TRIM39 [Danio aesculapii]XP_056336289.1 E3 ubiquitin-protein ligase TRIM39 [Danio aesculapii]XP_056336290.1 E3 ubiquitin-protein ligase TRIM39 [Danio aesculapii]XP_056336291.1 E3 ubiquitin-protein ligase TRIM39 [Danio aesculapii]